MAEISFEVAKYLYSTLSINERYIELSSEDYFLKTLLLPRTTKVSPGCSSVLLAKRIYFMMLTGSRPSPNSLITSALITLSHAKRRTRTVARCTSKTRSRSTLTRYSTEWTKVPTCIFVDWRVWCLVFLPCSKKSPQKKALSGLRDWSTGKRRVSGTLRSTKVDHIISEFCMKWKYVEDIWLSWVYSHWLTISLFGELHQHAHILYYDH